MNQVTISVHENDDAPEGFQIVKSLVAFNESVAESPNKKAFTISAKDKGGSLIGGINGYTHWKWLFISSLWVTNEHKGQGVGSRLMEMAEAVAKERGCQNAWLDTFSFQALPFYKKLGYAEFAHLEDYPPGSSRHFLRKKLRTEN